LGAKRPVSFFIDLYCSWDDVYAREEILQNIETQERLEINLHYGYIVKISRYPMGASEEWIGEMRESVY
jgi:hypothetical protein